MLQRARGVAGTHLYIHRAVAQKTCEGNASGQRSMIDQELKSWLFVTRKLPRVKGAIRLARFAQRTYLRKPRMRATVPVRDFKMCLDPADWVEGGLLFAPQLWDAAEVGFLVRNL